MLIISMLMPASPSARNMRPAMPGVPSMPVPTIDSLAMPPVDRTLVAPTCLAAALTSFSAASNPIRPRRT